MLPLTVISIAFIILLVKNIYYELSKRKTRYNEFFVSGCCKHCCPASRLHLVFSQTMMNPKKKQEMPAENAMTLNIVVHGSLLTMFDKIIAMASTTVLTTSSLAGSVIIQFWLSVCC